MSFYVTERHSVLVYNTSDVSEAYVGDIGREEVSLHLRNENLCVCVCVRVRVRVRVLAARWESMIPQQGHRCQET